MNINEDWAYIIGLACADGHMQRRDRGRGTFSIFQNIDEASIIRKIADLIGCNYSLKLLCRDTNFKKHQEIMQLYVCNKDFREFVNYYGMPYGAKSMNLKPPKNIPEKYIRDYMRGMIDGDGCVGFLSSGFPYIGFVTASADMKDFFLDKIALIANKPKKNCNKNGGCYKFNITSDDAVLMSKFLYFESNLHIDRKYNSALQIMEWERPLGVRAGGKKIQWTEYMDEYIVTNSTKDSMIRFSISKGAIDARKWRLQRGLV